MIGLGVILAVLLPAGIWSAQHPGLACVAAVALCFLAVGIVKFCREIAPSLSVASWPPSFARPPSLRPSWRTA